MNKCFFFDRDGIVNEKKEDGYIQFWKEFHFLPEFFELFKIIDKKGYLKILATNQQGIGKKLMNENQLQVVHEKMQFEIKQKIGTNFDDIYFSPDLDNTGSPTRKPAPGMINKAINKWDIDRESSWFIGDSLTDAEAGRKAGLKTILIGDFDDGVADFVFKNLATAINEIKSGVTGG